MQVMVDKHDIMPQPERSPLEMRRSIAGEVAAADEAIGSDLGLYRVAEIDSWQASHPREANFSQGFRRARTILQAISYGHNYYWAGNYGLQVDTGTGPATGSDTATVRLVQLVVLSRVPVIRQPNSHWSLPDPANIRASKKQLRRELGLPTTLDNADFSAISYSTIVDTIIAGEVPIGNPEQPEVQCWRP